MDKIIPYSPIWGAIDRASPVLAWVLRNRQRRISHLFNMVRYARARNDMIYARMHHTMQQHSDS